MNHKKHSAVFWSTTQHNMLRNTHLNSTSQSSAEGFVAFLKISKNAHKTTLVRSAMGTTWRWWLPFCWGKNTHFIKDNYTWWKGLSRRNNNLPLWTHPPYYDSNTSCNMLKSQFLCTTATLCQIISLCVLCDWCQPPWSLRQCHLWFGILHGWLFSYSIFLL